MKEGRFEIRSARTGNLEAAHADIESAIRYADELKSDYGESFFIVDLHLSNVDDMIVWCNGEVTDQARARTDGTRSMGVRLLNEAAIERQRVLSNERPFDPHADAQEWAIKNMSNK